MATQETTRQTVNRYFDMVYGEAEPELIASLFSEDVDFCIPGNVDLVPWIGRRKGRSGVANFIRDLRERVEPVSFDIRSIVVEGGKTVARGELESRVKSTAKAIKSEFAVEFTVQDGLIVRYRLFEDSFAVAQAVSQD